MRRGWWVAGGVVLGLLAACAGLGGTFARADLPVPDAAVAALPPAPRVPGVRVTVLPTARIQTQHGFSVRGASLGAPLVSAMVAVLVEHPDGPLLIDAGMGAHGVEHLGTTPLLMQALVELEMSTSVGGRLAEVGLAPADLRGVLLTHSHWDHVSGLEDLPGVPVWMLPEEEAFARSGHEGLLFQQLDAAHPIPVQALSFDGPAYGPFPRSWDVYGDGSVVAVPMPGHSPGSIGVVVNLPDGRRQLYVGDTAWCAEGVSWPAEKPWLSRRMVDGDAAGVRQQLVMLHRLAEQHPELTIVPAHDERVHATLASKGGS